MTSRMGDDDNSPHRSPGRSVHPDRDLAFQLMMVRKEESRGGGGDLFSIVAWGPERRYAIAPTKQLHE